MYVIHNEKWLVWSPSHNSLGTMCERNCGKETIQIYMFEGMNFDALSPHTSRSVCLTPETVFQEENLIFLISTFYFHSHSTIGKDIESKTIGNVDIKK